MIVVKSGCLYIRLRSLLHIREGTVMNALSDSGIHFRIFQKFICLESD